MGECCSPDCPLCLSGAVAPGMYRPHTLTPDCWCQSYRDDEEPVFLEECPKVCRMTRVFGAGIA